MTVSEIKYSLRPMSGSFLTHKNIRRRKSKSKEGLVAFLV